MRERKRTNVVEIAVEYAVHDLASHVVRVVEIGAGRKSETIWLRDSSLVDDCQFERFFVFEKNF